MKSGKITLWSDIFETLWVTLDAPSMNLAAALLSDNKQLACWWSVGWDARFHGKVFGRRYYAYDPAVFPWSRVVDTVQEWIPTNESIDYLRKCYEDDYSVE